MVAAAAGLATMTSRGRLAAAIVLGGCWAWSAASWTEPPLPRGWKGVDLEQGQKLDPYRNGAVFRHSANRAIRALSFRGDTHWLWRAVDQDGFVLDVLVQTTIRSPISSTFLATTFPRTIIANYAPPLCRCGTRIAQLALA